MTDDEFESRLHYELPNLMPLIIAIIAGVLILFWMYPVAIIPTIALLFPIGGFLHWLNCLHDDQEDQ